jgi:methyl-accepting chemotaxis protein
MLNALNFTRKMALLVGVAIGGLVLLILVSSLQTHQRIHDARKQELKSAVESMHSVVAGYHAAALAGQMSKDAAQAAAVEAIRLARFGGPEGKSEYFYIWTVDGVSVMHPIRQEWKGQNKTEALKDGKGRYTLKDITAGILASSNGRAFIDTDFPRPGQQEPVPKLQYAMKFQPWGWIVGSGLYMDDIAAMARNALLSTLLLGLTMVAAVSGVGFVVLRSVHRQLGGDPARAVQAMREVAGGNLGVDLGRPAPGSLMQAMQNMVSSLRSTVVQVRAASDSIHTASQEIASGNHDLSARTEQAASSLEETAASMEQLTSTVRQSADAARQANQLAANAAEIAVRGGQVVGQVVTTMDEINHSSKKISDIIGVIDGIAFQTNILALNAAVEAARAGEQGRGFAVVAGEVRNLAQRSAEAAKEIKNLIGASVNRVEAGSRLVADAGQTMSEIVGSVQRVSGIIGEITAAAGEQSDGIGQVNVAVTQLDQMTQQNAALVEESAAAAESLKEQATRLTEVIGIFRVKATLI